MTTNQSPSFSGHDAYSGDGVLSHLTGHLSETTLGELAVHGKWAGSAEALDLGRLANENPPKLKTRDANGDRIDIVEFHPAYHALMRRAVTMGLNGSVWSQDNRDAGHRHLSRATRFMLTTQVETGHMCPITMTNASVAALLTTPELARDWVPRIIARDYDASQKSADAKTGLTIGMGMTERQGGSDVRTNTTRAEHDVQSGFWRINGEKWFFSAPMCDAFLVLAQTQSGLSCFFVPRLLPGGQSNGLRFKHLKEKLGNHANASSEVEFINTAGTLVGEEGQGVRTIIEMVTLTRLDCAVGSAGIMRAALAQAVHHVHHRRTFGKLLIDQPLMTRVLADISLEVAAAQALTLRLAASFDARSDSEQQLAFARLMTPVVKYWVCKITPALVYECMECLGGNGYVEESPLPRLYREAPLNGIWEGSGNIMCLDVLRVIRKNPETLDLVLEVLSHDLGPNGQQSIEVLRIAADVALSDEGSARMFTEQLALTAAAAEMTRSLPGHLGEAFVGTRLGRPWRNTYGMMDSRFDARSIVDFVCPQAGG